MVSVNDRRRINGNGVYIQDASVSNVTGIRKSNSNGSSGPGLVNLRSGLGTEVDKSSSHFFIRSDYTEFQLETIYHQSWAAAKMIDIPVDDIWARGRFRRGRDEAVKEELQEAESIFDFDNIIPDAMKAGRLFGAAAIIVMPSDGDAERPLDYENIRPGEISNLWVTTKYRLSPHSIQTDPRMKGYGKPYTYYVQPRISGTSMMTHFHDNNMTYQFIAHHSRVIIFEGRRPLASEGWLRADNSSTFTWGISELKTAIDEILRDAAIHAGIGHLVQESSLFIMRMEGFKDGVMGRPTGGEPTIEELVRTVNLYKSIYRIMAADKEEEIERIHVNFAGIPDLMDRQAARLAAIADIPSTRFLSKSPEGMNATGSSDMQNYAIRIESLRTRLLNNQLKVLDKIIAGNFGITSPPSNSWPPLPTISEKERAEAFEMESKAIVELNKSDIISIEEARMRIERDPYWNLKEELPPSSYLDLERQKATRPTNNSTNAQ